MITVPIGILKAVADLDTAVISGSSERYVHLLPVLGLRVSLGDLVLSCVAVGVCDLEDVMAVKPPECTAFFE